MSLMTPNQIHRVLQEASNQGAGPETLKSLLEKNNLTPDEILSNLSSEMRSSEQPATRLRAAEIGLKLNGLLQGEERPDFHVTILIQDSEFSGANPILYPR